MNIIAIDPSITSTGLCVNGKLFNYSYEHNAYTKKGEFTKWYKEVEPYVNLRFHHQVKFDNYVEEQVLKLIQQKKVTDNIMIDILNNINPKDDTKVLVEGYSYGSNAGAIIDLVQFGTLIRSRLLELTNNIIIISPSTLKLETCKMVYPPIEKEIGKKKKRIILEHRNNEGVAGGKFTKVDMMNAIIEKEDWNNTPTEIQNYVDHLKTIDIGKNVPKPHEDISDSVLLFMFGYLNQ